MSIDVSYTAATAATGTTPQTTASNGDLDKQAFLDLLVAQLRNQDPSSPMDSSQLMAQTTQLTTMEKLVELSDTSRESFALQMRMAAAALVGQQVNWTDADGASHNGTVSGVSYAGSVPTVTVGDKTIALDAVAAVTAPTTPTA
ncbi:flagellar hook assembly protein FlgD [Cellulomonas fengjieae]|uniref:Flagellar hook capping protein n=1 Tax=Cellulomonas fengjieae TaxID=2819978 RepID=A0ABS3SGS0_9CELL|nr:flagellar hook capping FlgD N-terminal domain-containing protein [Cellulomonas fengjieae]MBO3084933.1 flagellar hook capping protein [Cellulomonas fengjieae]MBO3100680.1 flagellar hook capping protein [Cellulomonas fengjieae]QVI66465.1 flagellar hook capping protein [Cellulomonas fengjieae]